jgi:hypothetical protein
VAATEQLAAWGLDDLAFTNELIVSELVTNAIRRQPVIRRGNDAMVAISHKLSDNEEFRRGGLPPSPRPLAMMIIGALNELVADALESGRDIMEVRDLAIAVTTALLATNFKDRESLDE